MKAVKIITIERDTLVEELNYKVLNILIEIHQIAKRPEEAHMLRNFGWDEYCKEATNNSIKKLKKKQLAYFLGQADMLLQFVDELDVFINKDAHGFLRYFTQNH